MIPSLAAKDRLIADHELFLALGGLLFAGLVADEVGRRTAVPRVTLLMLIGFALGQSGFDLLPPGLRTWFDLLATVALTMVAFLLGGKLSVKALRRHGRAILAVSLMVVLATVAIVAGGLMAAGVAAPVALLLGGIATATAPAATQDVVRQSGAQGPFTDTLLGIVAIDDAWGLIIFSLLLVIAAAIAGDGGSAILGHGLRDIAGATAIGLAVGLPGAILTGRLRRGEPVQAEALALVFLCAGLALWLEVSYLLAGIVAGAVIVNLARHHNRPFHEIEHIEWPFMILFFVLAGASFNLASLREIGLIGLAYILLRLGSRLLGGWLGARLARMPPLQRRWIGAALVPQAGVALGMALVAGQHLPAIEDALLAIVIGTTVVFEIIGPFMTQMALRAVGEIGGTAAARRM